jgi:hypothetical protein
MNSNFPNGLSISHSSFPSTFRSTLGSLDTHVEGPNNFLSAEAQDEAIAKYGIAGRVWYKLLSTVSVVSSRRQNMMPQGSGLCHDALCSQPGCV